LYLTNDIMVIRHYEYINDTTTHHRNTKLMPKKTGI